MSHMSSEYKKLREKRSIAATIGYCFVIVLVVLLVMSSVLSDTYVTVLESERADAMESICVSSSAVLGHTSINEGMTYPLPVYSYAEGKPYTFDIYTKAGNSFLRLCTTSGNGSSAQYYLENVGDEYNDCFELQQTSFTRRTDPSDGKTYVCAIAPIISPENTVAGILEVRMPLADYEATVNGMSLSWVFTIFSIAVSMGIIIFEINLIVSTLVRGYRGNVPVLIIYGEDAIRFTTFFTAFGAIMQPVVLASYIKQATFEYKDFIGQILICLGLIIYAASFFGFGTMRKIIKSRLTERIALLLTTCIGFMLSILAGILDNFIVTVILLFPIAFCYGFTFDALRDFRVNASKLQYKGFEDRTIHNLQLTSYFFGVSVGAVIAGICFERFGLIFVSIIAGITLILSSFAIVFFFRENKTIREIYLPVNKWLEMMSDKYTGKFLLSTFTVLGIDVSFLLAFVPNFLPTVGISLATSSFYYLVSAFSACFIAAIMKSRLSHILTSKVRVIISSACSFTGLVLFALMPAAKMLVITVALMGISLGIHDYYFVYVLYLLCNKRFNKANVRKAAELSFLFGFLVMIPIFAVGLIFDALQITFAVTSLLFFLIAFIYPMSSFSNDVDDRDMTLRKKNTPKKQAKAAKRSEPSAIEQPEPAPAPAGQYIEPQQAPADTYINDLVDSINSQPDGQSYDQVPYADPYQDPYQQPNDGYYGGNDDGYVE